MTQPMTPEYVNQLNAQAQSLQAQLYAHPIGTSLIALVVACVCIVLIGQIARFIRTH
jgi:hypothetical protein